MQGSSVPIFLGSKCIKIHPLSCQLCTPWGKIVWILRCDLQNLPKLLDFVQMNIKRGLLEQQLCEMLGHKRIAGLCGYHSYIRATSVLPPPPPPIDKGTGFWRMSITSSAKMRGECPLPFCRQKSEISGAKSWEIPETIAFLAHFWWFLMDFTFGQNRVVLLLGLFKTPLQNWVLLDHLLNHRNFVFTSFFRQNEGFLRKTKATAWKLGTFYPCGYDVGKF